MHIRTPLIHSLPLSRASGVEIWLKMESAQPAGSFKIRGVGHACRIYAERGATAFVSSSGGNAGLSVAYAGRYLGLPVTVVVPETTKLRVIELIEMEEAKVIVTGKNWNAAHEYAMNLVNEHNAYVHPYDDSLLWDGHAGLIAEVAAEWCGAKPDLVVASVGGGGLLCGIAEGLRRQEWNEVSLLAIETDGSASLNAALAADEWLEIPSIDTIATSLGATRVSKSAFELRREFALNSLTVSDTQALSACSRFLDDHRVLVEPACGASLAAAYEGLLPKTAERVLIVVCGGVGVTQVQLQSWLKEYGVEPG